MCVCAMRSLPVKNGYVGELGLHLATLSSLRNNMQAEVDEEKEEIGALQDMLRESQDAIKEFVE